MPILHDPRQNRHGWWGTLLFDGDEPKTATHSVNGGDGEIQHVFVKTSRESHFLAQGTVVDVEPLGDTADDMLQRLSQGGVGKDVLELIRKDLDNLKSTKTRYYEITAVNDAASSPLARMHNIVTEVCFNNDHWLDSAGDIGVADIRIGRKLRSLKKGVTAETVGE